MVSQHDRKDIEMASTFVPVLSQNVQMVTSITIFVLGWISLSLELFIRKDFGERYISFVRYALASFVLGLIMILLGLLFGFGGFWLLGFGFNIAFIYHRIQITRRNKRGEEWHSMSFGVSHLEKLIKPLQLRGVPILSKWDDWFLYRFLEPAIFFVLGVIVWNIDNGLGLYIMTASFALFTKNQMTYATEYNKYLDTIDARIEAKYGQAALSGRQKKKTAGISVVAMPDSFAKLLHQSETNAPNFTATVQETMA